MESKMRSETTAILNLADSIPGYSHDQLLFDLEPLISAKKFYSAEELAVRYGVTEQTIRNWAKDHKLVPDLAVGKGCVRYSAAVLAEFEKNYRG
jgi:hypothetical protein